MSQDNINILAKLMKKEFCAENTISDYPRVQLYGSTISPANLRKIHRTISMCMKKREVPMSRQYIFNEFGEFTKAQIHFFTQIYFTFRDNLTGNFRIEELSFLTRQMGQHLDNFSLKYIFEKVDEDNNGVLSLREFLLLFRLAVNNEIWEMLSFLKTIVFLFEVATNEDDTTHDTKQMPNSVCDNCKKSLNTVDTHIVQKIKTSKKRKPSILTALVQIIQTTFASMLSKLN